MKKISLTTLFYCLLGLVFYSCCKDQHRILGSARLQVNGSRTIDTISTLPVIQETFSISDFHEIEVASHLLSDFGTQAAYAMQPCDIRLVNAIVIEETELYFDQALTLENVQLPASSNVLADSTFKEHIVVFHDPFRGNSSLEITLDSSFFYPPIFTDGPMNIRLVTKTEDGLSFASDVDVFIDMQ